MMVGVGCVLCVGVGKLAGLLGCGGGKDSGKRGNLRQPHAAQRQEGREGGKREDGVEEEVREVDGTAAPQHATPLRMGSSNSSLQTAPPHKATRAPSAFQNAFGFFFVCPWFASGSHCPCLADKRRTRRRRGEENKNRKGDPRFAHPPFTNNLRTHAATFPHFTPVPSEKLLASSSRGRGRQHL